MSAKVKSVAVLGTGIMGAPMARNAAHAGIKTIVWNRTRDKAEELRDDVHGVAASPAEAAANVDAVVTMLADGGAVRGVMTGEDGALEAMRDDAVWIQSSTIGIAAIEEMARLAAERGVEMLDAPVLGTKQPAEQGELTVLASGLPEIRERCLPFLNAIGAKVVELEKVGDGQRTKLVLNSWVVSLVAALAETVGLAEHLGVDPASFLQIIDGGAMNAPYVQLKGGAMIERSFEPSFPLRLARKDAELVLDAAGENGFDPAMIRAAERLLAEAVELGHGDEDLAAAYWARAQRPGS